MALGGRKHDLAKVLKALVTSRNVSRLRPRLDDRATAEAFLSVPEDAAEPTAEV